MRRQGMLMGMGGFIALLLGVFAWPATSGDWVSLFDGKSMEGWRLRHKGGPNGWKVQEGLLINQPPSTDIVTEATFGDFQLHVEFNLPRGSNSGVYLQGRYEIQVDDAYGRPPGRHMCGAIYGLLTPRFNAAKPAGEWQTFDVKFVQARRDAQGNLTRKARVSVIHNGVSIITNAELPGVTGGALDRNEGTPGPLMLQGDHGPVQYRNLFLRPLTEAEAESSEFLPLPPGVMAYKPLFDGKSLQGWQVLRTGHGTGGKWEAVEGVLQGTQDPPGNGGVLATTEKYGDFEVVVEINPDWGIDSGLFLRTTERGACYQITIDHRPGGQVGTLYGEGCGGWLQQNREWEKAWRKGEWNLLRAIVQGQPPRIQAWLNGQQLVDFTDTKERLPAEGFIAVQVHGGGDWKGKLTRFRNFRLRVIEER